MFFIFILFYLGCNFFKELFWKVGYNVLFINYVMIIKFLINKVLKIKLYVFI